MTAFFLSGGFVMVFYFMAFLGLVILLSAIVNWHWFFKQRRAQFFVSKFGQTGARLFYGCLGLLFLVVGLLVALGYIEVGPLN